MKRTLMLIAIATLTVFGQKIETQTPDRNRVTRLGTTQDHLSVIELGEPVTQVAAGSSSFKIEWRENKVFIQPLEPGATTNLFIWTASGRLSYELAQPPTCSSGPHPAVSVTSWCPQPPWNRCTSRSTRTQPPFRPNGRNLSNIRRSSNNPRFLRPC